MKTSMPPVAWSLALVPVQVWIAEARRSRDLSAGSAIPAWLMALLLRRLLKADAKEMQPHFEGEVLEAFAGRLETVLDLDRLAYGVPNQAQGLLALPADEAAALMTGLETVVTDGWEALRQEVQDSARRNATDLWKEIGDYVLAAPCPFQLVWCVEPSGDFEELDRLFAATKRARSVPPHAGAHIPKCSQCGRREAAGPTDLGDWRKFRAGVEKLPEVDQGLRIDASETLCGVCILKRLAGYLSRRAFASTSTVAARDWLHAVRSHADLKALLGALTEAVRQVPGYEKEWSDWAPLLFPRTVRRELALAVAAEEGRKAEALQRVALGRQELEKAIRSSGGQGGMPLPTPPEYLAVVVFDGDDMGSWRRTLRGAQPPLSERLAEFHRQVAARVDRDEVDPEDAPLASVKPFYLGGDEGLLLAPAGRVLELAAELRSLWRTVVERSEGEDDSEPIGPTLSVGVTVFDRERPLGPAIASAHQALAQAKELERKNGLAVTISTASGSRWTAVRSWSRGWDWARAATAAMRDGSLARGWPHDVERFLRTLPDEAWHGDREAWPAILEEFRRLTLRRAVNAGRGRRAAGEVLWAALSTLGGGAGPQGPSAEDRRALADQLHVVAFVSRLGALREAAEWSDAA